MKRKSPKRLIMDIDERIHADIKKRAADKYVSMNAWVMQAIVQKMIEENKYRLYQANE